MKYFYETACTVLRVKQERLINHFCDAASGGGDGSDGGDRDGGRAVCKKGGWPSGILGPCPTIITQRQVMMICAKHPLPPLKNN